MEFQKLVRASPGGGEGLVTLVLSRYFELVPVETKYILISQDPGKGFPSE